MFVVDETNLAINAAPRFRMPRKNYRISINVLPNGYLLA